MVGTAAGLDGDQSRWEPLEVTDHLAAPELATDDHNFVLINAVELKHRLGGVHANSYW
jgi:hypothetical protein